MGRTKFSLLITSISILAFLLTSLAWAQVDMGNFTVSGEAEVGGLPRRFSGSKSKFEEYRDVPETVIVPQLQLLIGGKKEDFYAEFNSLETGRRDQSYTLRAGKYGLLDMEFQWDQIPHLFSEGIARTPYHVDTGHTTFFTLSSKPTATTATSSCTTSPICQWLNNSANPIDLGLYNGIGRFNIRYTPNPGWTFTGTYWSNHNVGDRAFGTVIGPNPGTFVIAELAEPIDYQTHNVEFGGEYAGRGWSVGLKYTGSFFHNANSSIVWDNPINLTNSVGGVITGPCVNAAAFTPAAGTGPCQGRLDLYPNNQAHMFTLSGAATLPYKTSFMGTASYGWRLQDDNFLPYTINPAICPNPSTCLPSRSSLGGDMRPAMVNATLTNSFFDRVSLKAFERYYDLGNHNKTVVEPNGFIVNDQGAFNSPGVAITPEQFSYWKNNLGMEAGYNFNRKLSAKLSYGWERIHRDDREIKWSDEHGLGPTFDYQPDPSMLFRFLYRHYWRNVSAYEAEGDIANISRKFDEVKRNRDKVSVFSQYTPSETLTFHGGFELNSDRYPNVVLGTQNDYNYSPSVGVMYSPLQWLRVFTDYNWERFDWKLNAQQRSNTSQTPQTNPTTVWTSRGRDQIHTVTLGSDVTLIENLLGFRIQYAYSNGVSQVHSSGNPGGSVPASNYPDVTNQWHELFMRLQYDFTKNVAFKLGYYFNHATDRDFGVDIMRPWMGDVDVVPSANANVQRSIFLGDQVKGAFNANVGYIAVRLKF
jgi:MtrB/PioB family decaheme-associated outer membrane protein